MERIDEAKVTHIATLSRLSLNDDEIHQYTHQLADILAYASNLPAVESVPEEIADLRLGDDVAVQQPAPELLLRNARELEAGFVKVPSVLDRSESAS